MLIEARCDSHCVAGCAGRARRQSVRDMSQPHSAATVPLPVSPIMVSGSPSSAPSSASASASAPSSFLGEAVIPLVNKLQDIFSQLGSASTIDLPQVSPLPVPFMPPDNCSATYVLILLSRVHSEFLQSINQSSQFLEKIRDAGHVGFVDPLSCICNT